MTELERVGRASGVAAVLVNVVALAGAMVVSPEFELSSWALSDLGVEPETALLFNGGLVLTGFVALPFLWMLWDRGSDPLQQAAAVVIAAAVAALAGVGIFPSGTPLHLPMAVGFFMGFVAGQLLHGAGSLRQAATQWGWLTLGLAAIQLLAWGVWLANPVGGLAVPELFGTVLIDTWVLMAVRREPRPVP